MKNFKYIINGNVYNVVINRIEDVVADVEVNGTTYKVEMNKPAKKHVITINRPVQGIESSIMRPKFSITESALYSPLPGTILDIFCEVGDSVKKGQKLLILEAMKMENIINADKDGVIKDVKVSKGNSVLEGAVLVVIG
ncbi:MAG: acetyl-CoA carboxylase biotin carboxyl carrier protein subunit [Bacteroidales bacterium OttesenSCG-928-I14]|jgi:biotin carboxyl carrier protein|nr:acetyl-CoA carboxylase biotin carboxyl carrier protein subunit [Bacteroidales bacterium OttesenSCG-928-I14]